MYRQSLILFIIFFAMLLIEVKGSTMVYKKTPLNGTWQLEPGIDKPDEFNYQIKVPSLVDIANPALEWETFDYFWYKKDFLLPENLSFKHVYLHLEQVKYGTQIWINSRLIGEDIPCYTSQEFNLTPYLSNDGNNEILIRVGAKHTLPEHSAVGNDFEKLSFIPGIWGDVWLHYYGDARVEWSQIIPDINKESVSIKSDIENFSEKLKTLTVRYQIIEKNTGKVVSNSGDLLVDVPGETKSKVTTKAEIPDPRLWSPEDPFLYLLHIELLDGDDVSHQLNIPFGMREFNIQNGNFYLNGNRIVLKGSNICFHRMLSDSTRGTLPWDKKWISRVLVDIPKQNNMNFFRFHLGHAYNRWYDLADENGIMLQDEWMFWTSSGSEEQIEKEFRAWIKENCNHPSIVIWDALNESENNSITNKIIPELKKIDPTRPWEIVDFPEDHPYIYSLGPVLNREKFGYSRSIMDLKNSNTPTMVNEYLWWWLDQSGNPTPLTDIVTERWLGRNPSKEQLLEHQAYLASELTELWRRLDLDAIMPFVYLSLSSGATANWFFGPLNKLQQKPVLSALKNAFSPLGISIELWDRHFLENEKRIISVFLFNDTENHQSINLDCSFSADTEKSIYHKNYTVHSGEHREIPLHINFPREKGDYFLIARIKDSENNVIAHSKKPVHVYAPISVPDSHTFPSISILDKKGELIKILNRNKLKFNQFPDAIINSDVIFINEGGLNQRYENYIDEFTKYVKKGGVLIIQEPEHGIEEETEVKILNDLELAIKYRKDPERGGYDSYVFPEDAEHFIWNILKPGDFKMFNGGWGGEIIAQYNVHPTLPFETIAKCNLSLKVPALMEIPYGAGWVIISRIQIRDRLLRDNSSNELYKRRYDPIAEQYFWNLLTGYVNQKEYHKKIQKKLEKKKVFIARVKASSGQIYDALDGKMNTRWASKMEDPQWVWIDLGRPTVLNKITMHWEVAYGKKYEIYISDDDIKWTLVHEEMESNGGIDIIPLREVKTRYLKLNFIQRGTQWGYSIWELQLE